MEYSKYYVELKEEQAETRCEENLEMCGCLKDPYCCLESKRNITNAIEWTKWPDLTYAKVYDY